MKAPALKGEKITGGSNINNGGQKKVLPFG